MIKSERMQDPFANMVAGLHMHARMMIERTRLCKKQNACEMDLPPRTVMGRMARRAVQERKSFMVAKRRLKRFLFWLVVGVKIRVHNFL